ncbi:hypothetical protein TNCV_4076781 [Trichonephila clavipes]|nr:hypothetical protein TNCV_4076781 [Trichonephila clavipes]
MLLRKFLSTSAMSIKSQLAPSRIFTCSGIKRWGTSLQQSFRFPKSSVRTRPSSSTIIHFVRRQSFSTSCSTVSMFSGVRVVMGLPARGMSSRLIRSSQKRLNYS